MRIQSRELDQIKEWMTGTEDRISNMGGIGGSAAQVKKNGEEHKRLQEEFATREVN